MTGGFGRTIAGLMVRSILSAAGERVGLIGALGFCNGTTTRALGEASTSSITGAEFASHGSIAHYQTPSRQRR